MGLSIKKKQFGVPLLGLLPEYTLRWSYRMTDAKGAVGRFETESTPFTGFLGFLGAFRSLWRVRQANKKIVRAAGIEGALAMYTKLNEKTEKK